VGGAEWYSLWKLKKRHAQEKVFYTVSSHLYLMDGLPILISWDNGCWSPCLWLLRPEFVTSMP